MQEICDVIRQAVLADFWTDQLDALRGEDPNADMWQEWSPAVRNAASTYSDEFARAQRLPAARSL